MSQLQDLEVIFFKNHKRMQMDVNERIISFVGKNGTGKTNLLDAIYYLCFARSYFTKTDKLLQHNAQSGFRVNGSFERVGDKYTVSCIYREDGKKEILVNQEIVPKVSAFIGTTSCVMIAPDDISIVNEGSENRRKWMDTIFCQIDKTYLEHLQQYQKILLQRNALLKTMHEKNERSNTVLDFYNEQLHIAASYIFACRKNYMVNISKNIIEKYKLIAAVEDSISLQYQSHLQDSLLLDLLQANLSKDLITQRTNYGIHKDDIIFTMKKEPLKNIASQGQKKSFLLALKLAEFDFLTTQSNSTPILLLDDIFERLDSSRIHNLFGHICKNIKAQIFITDTDQERLEECIQIYTNQFKTFLLT